jgi:HPt (histidine-containing phosphotransfer) domain-containing protein
MAELPSEIRAKFEELRAGYSATLAVKMAELETAVRPLVSRATEGERRTALDTLVRLSHKLAGSAGTFEFPSLSQAAGNLEQQCRMLVQITGELSPGQCAEIDRLVTTVLLSCEAETGRVRVSIALVEG